MRERRIDVGLRQERCGFLDAQDLRRYPAAQFGVKMQLAFGNLFKSFHKRIHSTGTRVSEECVASQANSRIIRDQLQFPSISPWGCNPQRLRGAEPELGPQPDLPWRRGRQIAPELAGVWTAGFLMAPTNTRIVRRSNALLDWAYGRRFRYDENMSVGSSAVAPVASAVLGGVGNAMFEAGSRYFRLLPRRLVERTRVGNNSGRNSGSQPK